MARGLSRCVMPKTMEAQMEKMSAAPKCERSRFIGFFRSASAPSRLLSGRNVVRVDGGDHVEQPGANEELGAVVGGGAEDGSRTPLDGARQKVEQSVADVADEAQHFEQLARVGGVDLSRHAESAEEHDGDAEKDQRAANPAPLNEVPEAGDEPACQRCEIAHRSRPRGCGWLGRFFDGLLFGHLEDHYSSCGDIVFHLPAGPTSAEYGRCGAPTPRSAPQKVRGALKNHQLFLLASGDLGAAVAHQHVHLAAHAELKQVDPRLY